MPMDQFTSALAEAAVKKAPAAMTAVAVHLNAEKLRLKVCLPRGGGTPFLQTTPHKGKRCTRLTLCNTSGV